MHDPESETESEKIESKLLSFFIVTLLVKDTKLAETTSRIVSAILILQMSVNFLTGS